MNGILCASNPCLVDPDTCIEVNTTIGAIGIVTGSVLHIEEEPVCRIVVLRKSVPKVIYALRCCICSRILDLYLPPDVEGKSCSEEKVLCHVLVYLFPDVVVNRVDGITFMCGVGQH